MSSRVATPFSPYQHAPLAPLSSRPSSLVTLVAFEATRKKFGRGRGRVFNSMIFLKKDTPGGQPFDFLARIDPGQSTAGIALSLRFPK